VEFGSQYELERRRRKMIARRHLRVPERTPRPRKPFTWREPRSSRFALLRALASEYEYGDSFSKLYVALLARHIATIDPKVRAKSGYTLEQCGVNLENA
jgi:hypothetical protein